MKNQILVSMMAIFVAVGVAPNGAAAESLEPYPLEYFALRAVTSNVNVSPNGEKLAMLKILGKTGNPILHVYDTDEVGGEAFVVNADPMEIMTYFWASDKHIVMTLRQKTRNKVMGPEEDVYDYRVAILDVEEEEFSDIASSSPTIVNLVKKDPNKVIISEIPGTGEDLSLREAFRPRAYYELDLNRGTKKLLIRGRIAVAQIVFDSDGNPRIGRGIDSGTNEEVLYYRDVGAKDWDPVHRTGEKDFSGWMQDYLGFDDTRPGNILIKAFNGDDKLGLWSFNTEAREFDELIYRRSDVDVVGLRYHSNSWTYPDRVTGVGYGSDKIYFEYFDEIEGATYAQLEELIPDAHFVNITSRSRDGNTLVATNTGPRDPGTYYLLRDGKFEVVGTHKPLLDSERLADLEYISYDARDGRKIPAYLTVPNGEGPFPLVVLPHGGPHVHELVLFDEWAQLLANNGYMVVQPQYRMSMGHGFDHFYSAFGTEGSQAGRKMQDDKDDAALYLIEEGRVDPDRVAMFGWSYGGYAALVAASRSPQIYQCTIAGAAVSNFRRIANNYVRARGTGEIFRDDFMYPAVHPTEEADKVNIPVLLIHGDVDHRVLLRQADMYRAAMDKANKEYTYLELEGAGHFYNTLFFHHKLELYETIISFLQNDCGTMNSTQQASIAQN
jgi:dipeptidyl aminopeptidase/acylaminoacyl peptidase